jgi:hypothetical protein
VRTLHKLIKTKNARKKRLYESLAYVVQCSWRLFLRDRQTDGSIFNGNSA